MRSCDRRKCNVVRGKSSFVNRRKMRKRDCKALEKKNRIKNFEIVVKLIYRRLYFIWKKFNFFFNQAGLEELEIIFDY